MIIVIGADGLLGHQFCRLLGPEAIGLNRRQLDITDSGRSERILRKLKLSVIINCAGYTAVDKAEEDRGKCFAVNCDGVKNLAAVAARLDAILVQISTDYVFGDHNESAGPIPETSPASPRGVYATSKWEGEKYAANWPRHLIIRTCGLYGSAPKGDHFVGTVLRLAKQREVLRIVHDQRCNPTSTAALAEAVTRLLSLNQLGTFHVVSSPPMSWLEFAEEILRQANLEAPIVPITTAQYSARAPRPRYSVLDTTKYTQLTGQPIPSISQSLGQYLSERGE